MSQHRLRGHSTSHCEVFPDVYKSQVLHVKSQRLPADNASQGRNFRCKPEAGPGVPQPAPSLLWALTRGWTLDRTKGHTRGPADTADEHSSLHTATRARPSAWLLHTPRSQAFALAGFSLSLPQTHATGAALHCFSLLPSNTSSLLWFPTY